MSASTGDRLRRLVATGPARDELVVMTQVWSPQDADELQRQLDQVSERSRLRG